MVANSVMMVLVFSCKLVAKLFKAVIVTFASDSISVTCGGGVMNLL